MYKEITSESFKLYRTKKIAKVSSFNLACFIKKKKKGGEKLSLLSTMPAINNGTFYR